jgi:hypothetical protein
LPKLAAISGTTNYNRFPYNHIDSPYPNDYVFNVSSLNLNSVYFQSIRCPASIPAADNIDGIDDGSRVSHTTWLAILVVLLAAGSGSLAWFIQHENKQHINPRYRKVVPAPANTKKLNAASLLHV